MLKKALAFGEVLWDVYPNDKYIGGAPLNFAAHFAKCGGTACICSAVGRDELGKETLENVKKLNVGTEYISFAEKQTGKCVVSLDENQIPSYNLLDDTAYDYIQTPNFGAENFDVLYFGTLALRHGFNRKSLAEIIEKGSFSEIFVDMNVRMPYFSAETAEFAMQNASVLKISEEEFTAVSEAVGMKSAEPSETAAEICGKYSNIRIVIVTMGADGALAYRAEDKKIFRCGAEKVKAVSTVGAGDSFSAAFMSKYLTGADIPQCLAFAAKISGFVVSRSEAIPDYPEKL